MKKMLFVTTSYPFGEREASFVRPEIAKLSEKFDITLVSRNSVDEQTSQTPENVKVLRYNSKKSYSVIKYLLKTICSPYIYGEIITLIKKKKVSIAKIKKAIKYCMRSFHFADYLNNIRKEMGEEVVLYTYWNDYSVMSLSLIKQSKDKLVSRAHGTDLYERSDNNYYLPFKEISNRKTDLIAFISEQGKQYFESNWKTSSKKKVFYLGAKEQSIKTAFNSDNRIEILSFSNVVMIKRIDKMIDALKMLENDIIVNWTHIGNGDIYKEIKTKAETELSDKSNVSYNFLGRLEHSKALSYISENKFDFIINTSESEGLPVSIMEAMSFGIPAIALNVGAVKEIVKDEFNGFLLPSNADVMTIKNAICRYGKMTAKERTYLHDNAYSIWKCNFNSDENYSKFIEKMLTL